MKIDIIGNANLVDERINLIISELKPLEIYTVKLTVTYSWSNLPMEGKATYKSNRKGFLDLSETEPIKGCYKGIDSMGLFAGMKDKKGVLKKRPERDFTEEFITCRFTVSGKDEIDESTIKRFFVDKNIKRTSLSQSFRGEYYYCEETSTKAEVILLGGSEGGINSILPIAACLANKGFDVLALQYFSPINDPMPVKYLPNMLDRIPIEYVERATDWLTQTKPNKDIYIMGYSKGAELALISATKIPLIKKVVAISPSAYAFNGISLTLFSSWSYCRKNIPCIHFIPVLPIIDIIKNFCFSILNLPIGYWLTYELSKGLCINKEKTRIRIEDISGDICLIAGTNDTMWNSSGDVKLMEEILKKEERKYSNVRYIYSKAGHAFYPPFIFEAVTLYGGKTLPVLQANEDSWKKIVEFLF